MHQKIDEHGGRKKSLFYNTRKFRGKNKVLKESRDITRYTKEREKRANLKLVIIRKGKKGFYLSLSLFHEMSVHEAVTEVCKELSNPS